MTIIVERNPAWVSGTAVCGEIFVDDVHAGYSLEPLYIPEHVGLDPQKVYPIAEGTYSFVLNHSPHLGYVCPLLLDVPGHEDIRIHKGNWPSDSLGCTLIGSEHQEGVIDPKTGLTGGAVYGSKSAFDEFFKLLLTGGTCSYRTKIV